MTIINYVARTQDNVVLNDALHEGVFTQDRYLVAAQPQSILCAPLLNQGQLDGIVYLENNLTTGAFTPDRLEVLNLLSSQAAISIKNASLYRSLQDANAQLEDYSRTLEQRVADRTRQLQDKNQELEAANQQILAATERKTRFFNNMSHELRTPLDAIIGFSEVLEEQAFGALNDKQREYVNYILTSGTHLLSLINDILDLAKLDAGMMDLQSEAFPLKSLLESSLVMVQERASERSIALSLEVADEIDTVMGDERKVREILINLLSNAVKFTPDQGEVGIKATRTSESVRIAVWDTGVGIAPEDQPRIFEEFQQVGDKRVTKMAGTGLGLALTKKFVELHGGTIEVESRPGQGSTFIFSLPVEGDGHG
jgi:signal transduction histidine kinase